MSEQLLKQTTSFKFWKKNQKDKTVLRKKNRFQLDLLQGVQTRYDIFLSPRWPTKVDFHVWKRQQNIQEVWTFEFYQSTYFQKSNIGYSAI